jgi:hypothetical protein
VKKYQLNFSDEIAVILDNLTRRNDKTSFIEMAIRLAVQNKKIYDAFAWKNNLSSESIKKPRKSKLNKVAEPALQLPTQVVEIKPSLIEPATSTEKTITTSQDENKINFDEDFL